MSEQSKTRPTFGPRDRHFAAYIEQFEFPDRARSRGGDRRWSAALRNWIAARL